MAIKEDTFKTDDRVYLIRQMPPVKAVKVELIIAKAVGEPIFKAFTAGEGAKSAQVMTAAVGLLTAKVSEAELLTAMTAVLEHVGIDGKKVRICENGSSAGIDEAFQGRNKELWQVFLAALRVNFADFFQGDLSLSSLIATVQGSSQSSQPTSTGTSSDPASVNPGSATTNS
jgi:hypothetical protein